MDSKKNKIQNRTRKSSEQETRLGENGMDGRKETKQRFKQDRGGNKAAGPHQIKLLSGLAGGLQDETEISLVEKCCWAGLGRLARQVGRAGRGAERTVKSLWRYCRAWRGAGPSTDSATTQPLLGAPAPLGSEVIGLCQAQRRVDWQCY